MPAYAIGDIHGCVGTLRYLVEEKIVPSKTDTIYFLGDYINKGPDPKGVLDYVLNLKDQVSSVNCLRGNHEQYVLDALRNPWEAYGLAGRGFASTLCSFGARFVRDIPEPYIRFMAGMPYFYETESYILVHAGFNFRFEDPFRDDYAMLNIKDMEVDDAKTGGKVVLHGHVPTDVACICDTASSAGTKAICLDGGCVYTNRKGMSHLVAMEMESRKLFVAKNREHAQVH